MNRNTWEQLVVHNPMLIEIQRFRRRYLSFGGSNTLNSAVLGLGLVCYAGLVLMVMNGQGDISPLWIIMLQTGLYTLFAPGMLHGAIAGERERRSWDLLLVAPITKAQIVVGKFIGALAALAAATAMFLFPVAIAAVTYRRTNWHDLLLCELLSISFAIAVCSMTLLISARVKRPFMALGASLGALGVVLVVAPILLAVVFSTSGMRDVDLLYFLHPFYALGQISVLSEGSSYGRSGGMVSPVFWGWPQILVYLGLSAVMIAWASNTLNFAENEVKFIPKGHRDA
ncbi:ABC transporter permease [Fimbriimonas ginsengisoli]|uniref:ABC transporter permease n=1 Tax=Fimbriimonas ginsengisoli Gsoil 348 TaxID=661478 RepID=A0A068NKA4_FIMGI|nr:ABC transporter permease subunit [Fimbriimonas ginsengisoli]AIE83926.1 hypothetical protein OP10G_0558 [Fimbriimonas ginsengisoli Gsoil 348]